MTVALDEGDVALTDGQQAQFDLHDKVAALLTPVLGRKVSPKLVTKVVALVLSEAVIQALQFGAFKFPLKLGMLRIERNRPTWRRVNGERVQNPVNTTMKFVEGEMVVTALGRKVRHPDTPNSVIPRTLAFPAEQAAAFAVASAEDLTMLARDVASLLTDEGAETI